MLKNVARADLVILDEIGYILLDIESVGARLLSG